MNRGLARFAVLIVCYAAVASLASSVDRQLACQGVLSAAASISFTAIVICLAVHWGASETCGLRWAGGADLKRAAGYAPVLAVPACNIAFAQAPAAFDAASFITVALCAPVLEELCFRGYLLGALRDAGHGVASSVLAASALFAALHAVNALHGDAVYAAAQVAVAFFFALSLGLLRLDANSVVPCMFAHVLVNATSACGMGYSSKGLAAVVVAAAATGLWSIAWRAARQRRYK